MDVDTRRKDHLFQTAFPHPVAAPYRMAVSAHNPMERLAHLVATVDGLARYLATVTLADLFRQAPPADRVRELAASMQVATPAGWMRLLEELLVSRPDADWFLRPLATRLLRSGGKPARALTDLRRLGEAAEAFFGAREATDPEQAREAVALLEPEVHQNLAPLAFLADYPVGVIRAQAGGAGDTAFLGSFNRWMGHRTAPLPISVALDSTPPLDMVLVASPEFDRILVLNPFAQVREDGETSRFFLLSGMHDQRSLRLSSYTGHRITAVPLEVEGVPVDLPVWMGAWTEGAALASLAPSRDTVSRMRTRSRLLPDEKVFDGAFTNLGFIGRGGIGAVYRLVEGSTGEDRAVKILYPDLGRNEVFTRYFIETGEWLSGVKHPGLVRVLGAGYSHSLQQNHLMMEYLPGGSLDDLLARRDLLPPRRAVQVVLPLLEALAFLHRAGRLHGAIHPSNVLFDATGAPRLADFGIFKLPTDQVTAFRPLERIHSISYAAPEALLGGRLGPAADLYSVGVVLYRCLTGRMPDRAEVRPPSSVILPMPEELDAVVLRSLAMDPRQRHRDAEELRDALAEAAARMGPEYDVADGVDAQHAWGFLGDISAGLRSDRIRALEAARGAQDWAGVATSLQGLVDEIWDLGERVHYMLELAWINLEKLDRPDRAVSLYRECIEWDPENRPAMDTLVAYYRRREDWESLLGLFEDIAPGEEPARRRGMLEEMAVIASERLAAPGRAARYLLELGHMEAADPAWLDRAARFQEEAGDWAGAAETLQLLALRLAGRGEEQLEVLRRLAVLSRDRLEDVRRAVGFWEQIREAAPGDRAAREALQALYKETFSYPALAALLSDVMQRGTGSREQDLAVLQELGELLSSYLYDSRRAVEVWRRLLDLDPQSHTALSYLERLHLREGNHAAYLEVLDHKAVLARDPREKAEVLLTAAQTRERFFQDVAEARRLLQKALEAAPGHPGAEAALERLFVEHGDVEAQVDLLLSRLERTEEPGARLALLARLAELLETVRRDPAGALQVLQKMLLEAPEETAVLAEAGRIAGLVEDGAASLAAFLSEHASEAPRRTAAAWLRRAWELSAGEDELARALLLQRSLDRDPEQPELRRALVPLLRALADWNELARQLAVQVREVEPGERGAVLGELVAALREHPGDPAEAAGLLQEALAALPGHAGARLLYASLLRETGDAGRLVEVLTADSRAEDPAVRQNARLELAALHTGRGELAAALPWLEAALEADPGDPRVQERLEQALAETRDWGRLAALYTRLAAAAGDRGERIRWLEKAVTLQTELFSNPEEAAALLRQLLHLAPERLDLYPALETQLEALGRHEERVWLLEQRAGREADDPSRVAVLRSIAELQARELDNPDAAVSALRKALRLTPRDAALAGLLRELCEAHELWHAYVRAARDRAARLEGDEKVEVLLDMARVTLERMAAPASASKFVREALGLRPDYREAFELFTRILEEQGDWKGTAEALEDRLRVATDDERETLGLRLARVNAEHLGREVEALRSLERVMEINPENREAAHALAALYVHRQVWDKAAPLFQLLLDREDAEAPLELLLDGGRTFETILQRDVAVGYYRRVLARSPDHRGARARLAKLLYLEKAWEEAAQLARGLLGEEDLPPADRRELVGILADVEQRLGRAETSRENLERLLADNPGDAAVLERLAATCAAEGDRAAAQGHLERLLDVETDPERRFAHFLTLGDLALGGGDADTAGVAYSHATDLRPDARVAWVKAGEAALRREDFPGALEALARVETLETDPAARAAAAMTRGVILAEYLEDGPAAMLHLERALDHDPARQEAYRRLEALAAAAGDVSLLRGVFERQLARLGPEGPRDPRRALHQALASLALEKLGDEALAREHLERALELEPGDLKARERLASLHAGADEQEKAVDQYRDLLRRDPRNAEYLRQLRRLWSNIKAHDRAWCVAGVLVGIGAASEKEVQFYERFSSAALKLKPVCLTMTQWAEHIVAAEEDWDLSEVLRILYERIGGRLALRSPKEAGFGKKSLAQPEQARSLLAILEAVARVFGVPAPEVHLDEAITGLRKEATMPPCLVAGRDMLEGRRGKELRYEVGRSLSLFLPHHALAGVLDRESLKTLLLNTMKFVFPALPEPPGDPKLHVQLRKEMGAAFRPQVHEEIKVHIGELRRRGGEISLGRWLSGVEKTATRAGLVIGNDLPLIATLVQNRVAPLSRLRPEDLMDDLVLYTVSDAYAAVRNLLGITIM